MGNAYGQFCTVARGAEVLCQRWTPLVVRELLCGSKRFNDLHRGVPRMSTSLLAKRLRCLEEFGVMRRDAVGKVWEYSLSGAGEDLRPILAALRSVQVKMFEPGFALLPGLRLAGCRNCPCSLKAEVGRSGARREGQLSGRIAKASNRPGAGAYDRPVRSSETSSRPRSRRI